MSNSLDPDQARHFVGPDLGSNCLQKLTAEDTSRLRVLLIFSKSTFLKILSGTLSECQTVSILIRPYILSGLIWFQTICKSYQQTTLVG